MELESERRPILGENGTADTDLNDSSGESYTTPHSKQGGLGSTSSRSRRLGIVACIISIVIITVILAIVYTQRRRTLKHTVVRVECGLVEGVREELSGFSAFVFKGIPYAKPPVKNLRWQPPQPLERGKSCWNGVLNADKFQSSCSQLDFVNGWRESGSEDCLYLNVWTQTLDSTMKLPVIVWIHGGYLTVGSSSDKGYSPNVEFVSSMNVVAVSMNYRLNAFGFLALDVLSNHSRNKTSGNYGFMDQILALQWVRQNIARFGGDPKQVTVVGQSSGGTSIFGLLASKQANGLFQRAIAMSGSAVFNKTAKEASFDNTVFLRNSKCLKKTDNETLKCIYNLTQTQVLHAVPWLQYPYWAMNDLLDLPTVNRFDGALCVIDGVVVVNAPGQLNLRPAMPHRIEVMIGTTAQEIDIYPVKNFINSTFDNFTTFVENRLGPFSSKLPGRAIDLYKKSLNSTEPQLLYATMASDIRATCPNDILSRNLSLAANLDVYRYIVSNTPSVPANFIQKYHSRYSVHEWDSSALFGFHGLPVNYVPSPKDNLFKETIRKEFLHFFKTGRPLMEHWKTYPQHTGVFDNNGLSIKKSYHKKQCELWKEFDLLSYGWIN